MQTAYVISILVSETRSISFLLSRANPAGANLSPRGSLAPSGGGAIGCEPEAAALPVQRCGSEAMAANGQPFAFNVRTARYKLMHYVGGERTVREVSHVFRQLFLCLS